MIEIIFALLHVLFSGLGFALWRRWRGGWGGSFPGHTAVKMAVLFALTAFACWPLRLAFMPLPYALVCVWFLIRSDNGGGGDPIGRYGIAGRGYAWAAANAARIPAVSLIGLTAGGWTEAGELFLGAATGAGVAACAESIRLVLTLLA